MPTKNPQAKERKKKEIHKDLSVDNSDVTPLLVQ